MAAVQDCNSATNGAAVTPSDSTILVKTRALWIGGAGNVAVVFADAGTGGSAVTLTGATAGSIIPVSAIKVMSTNTTATNIVALY